MNMFKGKIGQNNADLHQSLCLAGICTDAHISCYPCTEIESWQQDGHGSQVACHGEGCSRIPAA